MAPQSRWYWVSFGIVLGILLGASATLMWTRTAAGWCDVAEKNCVREWISAMGGMGGAAATVLTILWLARQIDVTQHHHRQALRLQVDHKYNVASAVVYGSKSNEMAIREIMQGIAAGDPNQAYFADIRSLLIKAFEASIYEEFERDFLVQSNITVKEVVEKLKRTTIEEMMAKDTGALASAMVYNLSAARSAQRYVDRVDAIIGMSPD